MFTQATGAAARNSEGKRSTPAPARTINCHLPGNALRIKVPAAGADEVSFADRAAGEYRQRLSAELGDFVLRRADGIYSYQLAVVVDDDLRGVTWSYAAPICSGNTPRQPICNAAQLSRRTTCTYHWRATPPVKTLEQTQAAPLSLDNVTSRCARHGHSCARNRYQKPTFRW